MLSVNNNLRNANLNNIAQKQSFNSNKANQKSVSFAGAQPTNAVKSNFVLNFAESIGNLASKQNPTSKLGQFGQKTIKFLEKNAEFKGHNMSLQTLLGLCFGIVLGARLIQARDKNERREVATRDFAAVTTIIFGLPLFKKATSFITRVATGIPISHTVNKENKSILNNLWPNTGIQPASFEQLEHWYNGSKSIDRFTHLMKDLGGDLRKIFELVDSDAKKALNLIAEKTGSAKLDEPVTQGFKLFKALTKSFNNGLTEKLNIPNTTDDLVKMIDKASNMDNAEVKRALETLTNTFNRTKLTQDANSVLKLGNFLKSVPDIASIGIIAGFLGWFLPWFNIQLTKKLVLEEQAGQNTQTNGSNNIKNNNHPSQIKVS